MSASEPMRYATLTDLWRPPVESKMGRPISRRSRGSSRASLVVCMPGDDYRPREIRCEGALELKTLYVLAADRRVWNVWPQQRVVYEGDNGTTKSHFFDFVTDLVDGRRIAIAVRPAARALRLKGELARVATQWGGFADGYTIVHSVSRDRLHNARLIHAVRRDEDCVHDVAVRDLAATLHGQIAIGDLVQMTGLGADGFRAIVRLIADGDLALSPFSRICYQSLVRRPDEAHVQ